jgi:hypothetical protein
MVNHAETVRMNFQWENNNIGYPKKAKKNLERERERVPTIRD